MASERQTEEEVFSNAIELPSYEERAIYLNQIADADPVLAQRVRELLKQHDNDHGPLDRPPILAPDGLSPNIPFPTDPSTVVRIIGPYHLLEKLGDGGMGSVWLAEQSQPIQRTVAVKIVHPGLNSRAVLARFDAERHALERMDHPHIAKILDAGCTPDGRPYFVMELIRGLGITVYCDTHQLDLPARLRLFAEACQAVQHAHQKGIIHRDLKPSNILVTESAGRPEAKVIDFGIAKAIHEPLSERTAFTQHGQIVGTLEYMSPEQADFQHRDLDTRSDIYSLGVLLYELLTGTTPFERQRLRAAAFDEMLRVIREEEPPRPSVKLGTSEMLPSIASRRAMAPARLTRVVHGDLDWIVMKALEKDRERRYASAIEFAVDIERFLRDEPVAAGPPSRRYRLVKFIRRNRSAVLATAVVLAALVVGTFAATWGMLRAVRAERTAVNLANQETALRHEADAARSQEAQQREFAEAVADLLVHLFRSPDATRDGRNVTIAEVLDRAVAELKSDTTSHPRIKARVLFHIGDTLTGLGLYERAAETLQQARELAADKLGADDPDTLNALAGLARAYYLLGQREQAIMLYKDILPRQERVFGPAHDETLHTINGLGVAYSAIGDSQRAIPMLRQNLTSYRNAYGEEHVKTLMAMNSLGLALLQGSQIDDAVSTFEQALRLQEKSLGSEHPHVLSSMHNLGDALTKAGRKQEALEILRKCVDIRGRTLGTEHPATLRAREKLAMLLNGMSQYAEAVQILEETRRSLRESLGPDHVDTLAALNSLAIVYARSGRHRDALPIIQELLAVRRVHQKDQPRELVQTLANGGNLALVAGEYQRAVEWLEEADQFARTHLQTTDTAVLGVLQNLAMAYVRTNRLPDALRMYDEMLERHREVLGPDHRYTLVAVNGYAAALSKDRQYEKALTELSRAYDTGLRKYGKTDEVTMALLHTLATVQLQAGHVDRAIALGEQAWHSRKEVLGESHPNTLASLSILAAGHRDSGGLERAAILYRQCLELQRTILGANHPETLATQENLAKLGQQLK